MWIKKWLFLVEKCWLLVSYQHYQRYNKNNNIINNKRKKEWKNEMDNR